MLDFVEAHVGFFVAGVTECSGLETFLQSRLLPLSQGVNLSVRMRTKDSEQTSRRLGQGKKETFVATSFIILSAVTSTLSMEVTADKVIDLVAERDELML